MDKHRDRKLGWIFVAMAFFLVGCDEKSDYQFQGYVEGELVYIASPFSGELQKLAVSRGEKIKKDTLLYSLDLEPELSQVNATNEALKQAHATLDNLKEGQRQTVLSALNAQINQNQAALTLADLRVKRFKKLYQSRATSKDALDEAIANYEVKKALLKQSESNLNEAKLGGRESLIKAQEAVVATTGAQLQQAKWSLSQKKQRSPLDATVFDTFYWEGEWIPAGQPVLALLAPQYLRFIFFIPATYLNKVQLGQSVVIHCDACEKSYTATISYISPEVEYTPPVIFSRENNANLVYRIKAKPSLMEAYFFHPGQPVRVSLNPMSKHE